jgi:hypothetical protein
MGGDRIMKRLRKAMRSMCGVRARMMKAVEYSKRKGFNYQKCAGVFCRLQHEANEGTHNGHFKKLEEMFNFYVKTA